MEQEFSYNSSHDAIEMKKKVEMQGSWTLKLQEHCGMEEEEEHYRNSPYYHEQMELRQSKKSFIDISSISGYVSENVIEKSEVLYSPFAGEVLTGDCWVLVPFGGVATGDDAGAVSGSAQYEGCIQDIN